jgi:hypothetical protein
MQHSLFPVVRRRRGSPGWPHRLVPGCDSELTFPRLLLLVGRGRRQRRSRDAFAVGRLDRELALYLCSYLSGPRVNRGVASATFLDATVVRMVLVPAVMQLLGSRNWWIPNWLGRILLGLDVERVAVGAAQGRT